MDFFYKIDRLNREPPYAFTWDHFLFIVLYLSIGVLLAFLLRKKDKKTIKIVLISLWVFYLVIKVTYLSLIYGRCIAHPNEYPFDIRKMLPLHSCLMFMYVFPFAIFTKKEIIRRAASNFLVVVNMIMGFITLFVGCPGDTSALSFFGQQTLIYHSLDVIVPLIMLVTGYYDIKKNDIFLGLIVFAILAVPIWIFDLIAGCDYFYFFDGSTFPVFGFISSNVPNIVWTLIVVSSYVITAFAMHYLVIGIKYLVNKKTK